MTIYNRKMLFIGVAVIILTLTSFLILNKIHDENDKKRIIELPIIMYHHFDDDPDKQNDLAISQRLFAEHLIKLKDNNYTPIFYEDVYKYVNEKGDLPRKPIIITFDDGYKSNFDLALPMLTKFKMKAEISIVGATVGLSEADIPGLIPHFSWQEAKYLAGSGLCRIESHTYDFHKEGDGINVRSGVLQLEGEDMEDYRKALQSDFERSFKDIEKNLNKKPIALTYPYGKSSEISEETAESAGFLITVGTEAGVNIIKKGGNLNKLKRLNIGSDISGEKLLLLLDEYKTKAREEYYNPASENIDGMKGK